MARSWLTWADLELATTGHLVTLTLVTRPQLWPLSSQSSSQPSLAIDDLRTPGHNLLGWAFLVTIKGWLPAPSVYICPWQ